MSALGTVGARIGFAVASLSPTEAAAKLGVSTRTLRRLVICDHGPSAETLISLSRLGWSASWLLTGEGNPRLDSVPTARIPAPVFGLALLSIECFRPELQAALQEGAARVIPTVMLRACVLASEAGEPIAAHHVTQAWADIGGDA